MYKTSRLVRISFLINALNKGVLLFFWGKLFYKSNRKLFSCVCISWYKHERSWENSRQLCKPETKSRVCITVENSPNPSRVYIRLWKHGKRFLLINYKALIIAEAVCCWSTSTSVNQYHTLAKHNMSPQFPEQYHIVTNYNHQNWIEVYNMGKILLKMWWAVTLHVVISDIVKKYWIKRNTGFLLVLQQRTVLYKYSIVHYIRFLYCNA